MNSRAVRLLTFAAVVVTVCWAPFALPVLWFREFPATPAPQDFNYYYDAARVGITAGWKHIYDVDLQRQAFYSVRPPFVEFGWATIFVSLPPMAWIVAPLALLSYATAYWSWVAISVAVYGVVGWLAMPVSKLTRVAILAGGIWLHPAMTNLQMGQNSLIVAVLAAAGAYLVRARRPVAAGVVLGVAVVLKPQVAGLVPLAVLLWNGRKVFFVSVATASVLVVASLLSLGLHGLDQLRADLALEQAQRDNAIWTPAILVGQGYLAIAVQAAAAGAALAAAFFARGRPVEYAVVAGLLATLAGAGYHHEHDFVALVVAGWLWVAASVASWWKAAWLAAGFLALAFVGPFGPGPVISMTVLSAGVLAVALAIANRARDEAPPAALSPALGRQPGSPAEPRAGFSQGPVPVPAPTSERPGGHVAH